MNMNMHMNTICIEFELDQRLCRVLGTRLRCVLLRVAIHVAVRTEMKFLNAHNAKGLAG